MCNIQIDCRPETWKSQHFSMETHLLLEQGLKLILQTQRTTFGLSLCGLRLLYLIHSCFKLEDIIRSFFLQKKASFFFAHTHISPIHTSSFSAQLKTCNPQLLSCSSVAFRLQLYITTQRVDQQFEDLYLSFCPHRKQ